MLWTIILFSGSFAGALMFFVMAGLGLRRRRIGYEPSAPPVEFASRPVQFGLLILLYAVLGSLFTIGAVKSGTILWSTL